MTELYRVKKPITHTVTFLLIMLWVYAAVSKLGDVQLFAAELRRQPLPPWSVPLLLWWLPVGELMLAAMLCFPGARRAGLLASAMLLGIFALYTLLALSGAYGSIPCSCGGIFSVMGWKGHLVFNMTAAALSVLAWRLQPSNGMTITRKRNNYA